MRAGTSTRIVLTAIVGLVAGATGCAASGRLIALREAPASAEAAPPPPRLTRSLFAKPFERQNLSEEAIQQIVNAPVDPDFPARAGVVVLSAPFTRSSYASLEPGDEAPQLVAREIEASSHFVMVSDISPYLADGQHIESLRELATRYRLKYLVVLNTRYVDRSRVNRWGWGWLSLIGIPFLPAYSLRTDGLMEATLLDVRTGTFLFTTQVHIRAADSVTPFGTTEKLAVLQRDASRRAARLLARAFVGKCNRLVAEVARRGVGSGAAAAGSAAKLPRPSDHVRRPAPAQPAPPPAPRASAPGGA